MCYDWSKGAENHNPSTAKNHIFLHLPQVYIVVNLVFINIFGKSKKAITIFLRLQESEVKGKPRVGTSRKWSSSQTVLKSLEIIWIMCSFCESVNVNGILFPFLHLYEWLNLSSGSSSVEVEFRLWGGPWFCTPFTVTFYLFFYFLFHVELGEHIPICWCCFVILNLIYPCSMVIFCWQK